MEIKDLESLGINETSHTLDVTFRLQLDKEDEIRTDQIELDEVKTFGYNINESVDDFYEDDDEDFDMFGDFEDEELDEDEIISFLNEYYLIYPTKLPEPQLF
jgi:hypothetical protein